MVIRERNVDLTFATSNTITGNAVNLANASFSVTGPYVIAGNRVASIDPTSFGLADRGLMDFTSALSGLLTSAPISGGGFKEVRAATPMLPANRLGQGVRRAAPAAGGQRRGCQRQQFRRRRDGLRRPHAAKSADRRAEAGGGEIDSTIDLAGSSAKTGLGFGGVYGHYQAGAAFFDAALIGGGLSNGTTRTVTSNLNGTRTANGSFGGWFVEPEATLGYGYTQGGWTLTPAFKLRYLGSWPRQLPNRYSGQSYG